MTRHVSPDTLKAWLHDGAEIALLDVREHGQFGASHLFYAAPLPFSRLELDIARLVPRRGTRCVVCDSGEADTRDVAERAAVQLAAIGYEDVFVLQGGTRAWQAAGYTLFAGVNLPSKTFGELAEHAYGTPQIGADELAAKLARGERIAVLDGRPLAEFGKMNIPTAICCPNGELAYRVRSVVPDARTPIVINCAGRTRSIIGAQTLINLGVPNPVYALENGTQGWFLRDHELERGSTRAYAPGSGSAELLANARRLARRFGVPQVDAATVLRWYSEPDRSLYLCDVRTPEEFAQGSLPGAQHTPGGQLLQAFDQYVGVRGARLVLFDGDDVRAPTVASWLRQMGHDASVLEGGLNSGLALPREATELTPPALEAIGVSDAAELLAKGEAAVVDLRGSMAFRHAHVAGARWSTRQRLREDVREERGRTILVADDPALAAWAAASEWPEALPRPLLLEGGLAAWHKLAHPIEASAANPPDGDCIDFLFFVHDRHDGNKEAARRYIEWETGLVRQLDDRELAAFRLPAQDDAAGSTGAAEPKRSDVG